jgi:hypothetical protein
MNFKYGIYIKTYKRIDILEETIEKILEYTDTIGYLDMAFVVSDDQDTDDWVGEKYRDNKRVGQIMFDKRRGSCGAFEKAINDSIKRENDYTIVFEDDCFPYKNGWLELIDDFMGIEDNPFKNLINFSITNPLCGMYEGKEITPNQIGSVRNSQKVGDYDVIDSTVDNFVISITKNEMWKSQKYIVHPEIQIYGYWHSEMQHRLMRTKQIPWKNSSIKQLEEYICARDYIVGMNRSGISEAEKKQYITQNRKPWAQEEMRK